MIFRVSMFLKEPNNTGDEYPFKWKGVLRTSPFKSVQTVFYTLDDAVRFLEENSELCESFNLTSA